MSSDKGPLWTQRYNISKYLLLWPPVSMAITTISWGMIQHTCVRYLGLKSVSSYCLIYSSKLEVCVNFQKPVWIWVCVGVGVGQSVSKCVGGGFGLGPLTPLGPKKLSANGLGVSVQPLTDVTSGGRLLALLTLFTYNRETFQEFSTSSDCGPGPTLPRGSRSSREAIRSAGRQRAGIYPYFYN